MMLLVIILLIIIVVVGSNKKKRNLHDDIKGVWDLFVAVDDVMGT